MSEAKVTVHILDGVLNGVKVEGLPGRVQVVVIDEDTQGIHDEPVTTSEFVFVDGKEVMGGEI